MICLLFLQSEVKRVLELVEKIFDNIIVLRINGILGVVLLFTFVCYFFSREGRDERGKKIIATAALTSFFALFILLNIIPMFLSWLMEDYTRLLNGIQTIYSIFLLIANVTWIILRKVR